MARLWAQTVEILRDLKANKYLLSNYKGNY